MRVHWTETAVEHLTAIHEYIAKGSPVYARRMVDRLTARSKQIADFPLSGRMVPDFEALEVRAVIEGPYRLIYRVHEHRVEVLAVVHGARPLPPNL